MVLAFVFATFFLSFQRTAKEFGLVQVEIGRMSAGHVPQFRQVLMILRMSYGSLST